MTIFVITPALAYAILFPLLSSLSTVGAANHTLFICITVLTAVFYIASLWAERWLRHMDRLPEDVRRREKVYDWLAIFFGTVGGIALILLGVVSHEHPDRGYVRGGGQADGRSFFRGSV